MLGDDGPGSDLDELFTLLQPVRRRLAIEELQDYSEGDRVPLRELARVVAAAEFDVDQQLVSNKRYRSVRNSLAQTHLPQLIEFGAIDYNPRAKTVWVTAETHELGQVLVAAEAALNRSGLPQDRVFPVAEVMGGGD